MFFDWNPYLKTDIVPIFLFSFQLRTSHKRMLENLYLIFLHIVCSNNVCNALGKTQSPKSIRFLLRNTPIVQIGLIFSKQE